MKKLFAWFNKYALELGVILVLGIIPLYPKLPLIDIPNTWVYIRVEDFLVALIVSFWLFKIAKKQTTWHFPLAVPILVYWLVGGISLGFSLIFLKAHLANFFPNVAVLHYLRRIEYMIVFFVAAGTVKDIKVVKRYTLATAVVLLLVAIYGFGQKFFGFPAFLTMNEEFAKGIPLHLPSTARIASTFAGHYDLAAYLVLMIGIFSSMIFGLKKPLLKIGAFGLVLISFILLLFTASRVSFFVYLVTISFMLLLQKKKWLIIPVIFASIFLMKYVSGVSERFNKTLRVENVVYNAKTGTPIATVEDLERVGTQDVPEAEEDLPLGSGFLEVPIIQTKPPEATEVAAIRRSIPVSLRTATSSSEIATIAGEFLIKRTLVYDISFTTRFQGTWPRAFNAFKRNPILGTGYSSVNLATDNSYLRALGETGVVGLIAFVTILVSFGFLAKQGITGIKDTFAKSLVIGITAGIVGIAFNAILIDIYEASKVAFVMWAMLGIATGLIVRELPKRRSLWEEAKNFLGQPLVPMVFILVVALPVYWSSLKNYFVGDDFIWLKWAATTDKHDLLKFFVSSDGFFYRPLAKIYFFLAYQFSGLRPQGYHFIDLSLHLAIVAGVYCLAWLLSRKRLVAFVSSFLFLIHPIVGESVLWISSTSSLFASVFYIWGLVCYIVFRQTKIKWLFPITLIVFTLALFSHELAVTFPLVIIFYDFIYFRFELKWSRIILRMLPFVLILGIYGWLRNGVAQSHLLYGDYNYSLKNLPFNLFGNTLGYIGELIGGLRFVAVYDFLRSTVRQQKEYALVLIPVLALGIFVAKKLSFSKNTIFGFGFFFILMLPFLALGNIAERHTYPGFFGIVFIFALAISFLYQSLSKKSLLLGITTTSVALLLVGSFYLSELNQVKKSWFAAGEISNKILLALGTNFDHFPSGSTLYFVNMPLRFERAWIFPVGLRDGIWFIYKDENLLIEQSNSLESTIERTQADPNAYIFYYAGGVLNFVE